MTRAQTNVLSALGRQSHSAVGLAAVLDARVPHVQRTLDALYRKSLVTITPAGRWCATERGRAKASERRAA